MLSSYAHVLNASVLNDSLPCVCCVAKDMIAIWVMCEVLQTSSMLDIAVALRIFAFMPVWEWRVAAAFCVRRQWGVFWED